MKCQILFSGKNKKNNIILSSAENAQRVVKVKLSKSQLVNFWEKMGDVIIFTLNKEGNFSYVLGRQCVKLFCQNISKSH